MMQTVTEAITAAGFEVLGGFVPEPGDAVPALDDGQPAAFLIVVGNVGPRMFAQFSAARDPARDKLDDWCEDVLGPIARAASMRAVFAWDRPYLPFQKWAARVGAGQASPLGMSIHPDYGLWFGLRSAFICATVRDMPVAAPAGGHSCAVCADKPCLSGCPVDAFVNGRDMPFNPDACVKHLQGKGKKTCLKHGCSARLACPVGKNHAYSNAQIRFHLNAFLRSRTEG